ncbi:MAG: low specificity L-threonine aldolase [Verrucomicrobia bacterium]|nr:low specificity L-threonine aldolase [Verrucomicrobiota bacterium]
MTHRPRHFASDNNAGISPEVLTAIVEANQGHVVGYGHDDYTERAVTAVSEVFERECAVFFVSNGTSANCLALSAFVESYHAVIAHEHSHLETDECNALGYFVSGAKAIPVGGPNGKIDPGAMIEIVSSQRPVHGSLPRAVSLTNLSELGTVYRPDEIRTISDAAKRLELIVHVDGARFGNAVASIGCSPADLTWRSGVDVLSFGGTKNGLGFGEAIVFFDPSSAADFEYRLKQTGQLASKMRFLSAPWLGYLKDGLWLDRAKHANGMAERLENLIRGLAQAEILYPREGNAVFARIPNHAVDKLHERGWRFYNDVGPDRAARLMCSWDTTKEDVSEFAADLEVAMGQV